MNIIGLVTPKIAQLEVVNHKTTLPSDLKYLTQLVEYHGDVAVSTDELKHELALPSTSSWAAFANTQINYRPMRMTTNPFHDSICLDKALTFCPDCENTFSVSPTLIVTTTLKEGTILASYLGYATDAEGEVVIPDSEQLKEALLHYVLYRYWMSKYQMKEDGSDQRMKFHLSMWNMHAMKATGNLNMPDVNELENLMKIHNQLVPRQNKFDNMFINLASRQDVHF